MAIFFVFLSLIALVSCAIWINGRRGAQWKRAPGPRALPLIGHLHMMAKPGVAPHTLLKSLARRYGPIMSLQFGSVPVVVASNATAAKEFLKTHDATFASRPPLASGRIMAYGSNLVFAPYGDLWRHLRRLATMELFSPRRVEMFKSARQIEVRDLCETLLSSSGSLVEIREVLKTVVFNIITFMTMNKRYFGKNVENQEEAREFIHANDDLVEIMGEFPIGDYFPALSFLDPVQYRMKAISKSVDKFLNMIIADHEQNKLRKDEEMDFLDILLDLRDKGEQHLQAKTLKGLMINLLSAGTDTSFVTIEWALAELIKHPEVMSKAQEEINHIVGPNRMVTESDLPQLHYLQAIVKEIFRLHPPIPILVPHSSTEDSVVMGYHVPRKSTLLVNVYAIGRDESVWEKPTEFKPERFVGSEVDVRGQNFEVLPFGSGRRMCPGINLGLATVQLTLANMVHGFDWEASVDTVSEHYGLSLLMTKKLDAVPRPRLSPHAYKSW